MTARPLRTDLILLNQGDELIGYRPDRDTFEMVFTVRRAGGEVTEERFDMASARHITDGLTQLIFADPLWPQPAHDKGEPKP